MKKTTFAALAALACASGLSAASPADYAKKMTLTVDPAVAGFGDAASVDQQLVDWTYGGASYAIALDALALKTPNCAKPGFYATPREDDVKSALWVRLQKNPGFTLIFR